MTSQQVLPSTKQSTLEITNAETSSHVTNKILAWSISEILKDRHVFPADAFTFGHLGGGETVALKRQAPDERLEEYQVAVNQLIGMLGKVFKGVSSHLVQAVIVQFHDGEDHNKLYEEWRFEVDHRGADGSGEMNVNIRGSLGMQNGHKTLEFGSQNTVDAALSDQQVTKMALDTLGKIRDAMKTVKQMDFDNNDIRLGLVVHYTKEAFINGQIPSIFDIQEDGPAKTHMDNPSRFRVGPVVDLKYSAMAVKMKTSLFRGKSAKKVKVTDKRKST